jgi:hypothetical protein
MGVNVVIDYGDRYGNTCLSLQGIGIDTVSFAGELLPILPRELEDKLYEHLVTNLYRWKESADLEDEREYVGGGTIAEAWWRTITRDLINEIFTSPGWRRTRPDDEDRYEMWWWLTYREQELDPDYEDRVQS